MTVSTPSDGNTEPVTWETGTDQQRAVWLLQMEADYRSGIKPLRLIGAECGKVSHTFVGKKAKEGNWARDLHARITARADQKVSKAAVSTVDSKAKVATEAAVVEANATLQYQVRMAHRLDIARGRKLWDSLASELEAGGFTPEQVEQLLSTPGDQLTSRQRSEAKQALSRVLSIGSRVASFNTLVHSLERLTRLERQAFGIGDDGGEGDNPAHPAGVAPGHGRGLSDAERAIRLARILTLNPGLLPASLAAPPGATAAPVPPDAFGYVDPNWKLAAAVPVPPGRE